MTPARLTLTAAAGLLVLAGCGGGDDGVRPTSLPTVSESACRAAVAAETRSGAVSILRSSGSMVTIRGPGGTWTCQTNANGDVIALERR